MSSKTLIDVHQYNLKFSFSISEIAKDWSCLEHDNTYLSIDYLTALEQSDIDHLRYVYVVIYRFDRPVGVMYFQSIDISKILQHKGAVQKQIKTLLAKTMAKRFSGQLLLCGNFFATGVNGFVIEDDVPPHVISDITRKLRKELRNVPEPIDSCLTLFKEFWKENKIDLQSVLLHHHNRFEIDVNMILTLSSHWTSFEKYLFGMKTKYRRRAKKTYEETLHVQQKKLNAKEIKSYSKTIHQLYLSVVNSAEFNVVTLSDNSFYLLKQSLGDKFTFTGYFIDHNMVAFSTACKTENYLDANYVGINYDLNQRIPLYQRVLYDYVSLAIHKRVEELRLGRTAELIKSSLGAEPKTMYLYLEHNHRLGQVLLKPLLRIIEPNPIELRNPFKKKL